MKRNYEDIILELNNNERKYGSFTYSSDGFNDYIYYNDVIIIDTDNDDSSEYIDLPKQQFIKYVLTKTKKTLNKMINEI